MSKILGLETATNACSVALCLGEQVISRFTIAPRRHTELLLPMVDELLQEVGIELSTLDAIAFGQGPGSFMGLRLACGVAQGLAFGAELSVIPVSTLQVLAQTAFAESGITQTIVGWDARMDSIYWGLYSIDDNKIMQALQPDQLTKPNKIHYDNGECIAIGNAWRIYQDQLPKPFIENIKITEQEFYPNATSLVRIAANEFSKGKAKPAKDVLPVYLREKVTY
jgi:tRNA threonylcarbamoyladenosine biosynthesis protein TsaB